MQWFRVGLERSQPKLDQRHARFFDFAQSDSHLVEEVGVANGVIGFAENTNQAEPARCLNCN